MGGVCCNREVNPGFVKVDRPNPGNWGGRERRWALFSSRSGQRSEVLTLPLFMYLGNVSVWWGHLLVFAELCAVLWAQKNLTGIWGLGQMPLKTEGAD